MRISDWSSDVCSSDLRSDFALGIGNRWANRHTGSIEVYTKGRKFVHVDIEPTQIGRVFMPDYGIVPDAKAALEHFVAVARERKAEGQLTAPGAWQRGCQHRKPPLLCKPTLDAAPLTPLAISKQMNEAIVRDNTPVNHN